jgi:hypothetical protein
VMIYHLTRSFPIVRHFNQSHFDSFSFSHHHSLQSQQTVILIYRVVLPSLVRRGTLHRWLMSHDVCPDRPNEIPFSKGHDNITFQ